MPVGGLSNGKIYGEKETYRKNGSMPALIPDLKGLMGTHLIIIKRWWGLGL